MRPLHISELSGAAPPKPKSQRAQLEDQLEWQMKAHRVPAFLRQHRLIKGRRWTWDFVLIDPWCIAIEIQGLVIMRDKRTGELITRGGHATPQGMRRDMEKQHAVLQIGYTPLSFERNHISSGYAIATLIRILALRGWGAP